MFSRMLIPVVDTSVSQRAARLGLEFAWRLGASLVVFHATDQSDTGPALALLAHWEEQATTSELRSETLLAQTSDVPRAIVDAAQVKSADLIVMGTHAREGLPRLLLGSVAERVLHSTPLPLMLVRDTADAQVTARFQRVLIPLDGSQTSDLALEAGIDLAKRLGSSLTLLHVVPEPPLPTGDFIGAGYAVIDWEAQHNAAKHDGERILADASTRCGALEVRTRLLEADRLEVGRRDPGTVILEIARDEAADLIVMGTHARRGLDRLLLGSVAERVAHHADVPVLLLRAIALKAPETVRVPVSTALPEGVVG
jgi:nucleotide-binding universal stress UspA family protein